MNKIMLALMMGLAVMLSTGCSNDERAFAAAPLGDRPALETLADAYTDVSNKRLTVSPMTLHGKDRRDFLVRVFNEAGYDYSATLRVLAMDYDKTDKLHKDMAELVLMPHRNLTIKSQPAEIYLPAELMDIATLERRVKQ